MSTIALGVVIFVSGYFVGQYCEKQNARRLTSAEVPLVLRSQALLEGKCPICDFNCQANSRNLLGQGEVSNNTD